MTFTTIKNVNGIQTIKGVITIRAYSRHLYTWQITLSNGFIVKYKFNVTVGTTIKVTLNSNGILSPIGFDNQAVTRTGKHTRCKFGTIET